ncbi:hypothetical protein [Actinokineospora pegani]|uniref:hypothetical protein n=1 Tax=Actinokineospora pegani TaxID=2654637 RepID=UPI0012E99D4D|nr:hypothetical protein [Actinokineospora pegani]
MTDVHSARDLYALPREEFTAARDTWAKAVKADGDTARAAEIRRLAKPTTSAWLLNRLVRQDQAALDSLVSLGKRLRAAHTDGSGADLRALTRERTALLRDLVRAAAAGESPSEAVTRELEDMLTAAITDADATERLLDAQVTSARDLAITPSWPGLTVAKPLPAKRGPETRPSAKTPPVDRAAVKEARSAVKAAEADRAGADHAVADAEEATTAAEDRVRELNALLDEAETAELDARRRLQSARRQAKAAERAAGLAWRKLRQVEGESG